MIGKITLLLLLAAPSDQDCTGDWTTEKLPKFEYRYTSQDEEFNKEYQEMLISGINAAEAFFKTPFPKSFTVTVHPCRKSWDEVLQKAYNMPDFASECWMVASGEGYQMNMISPARWETEACEHRYSEKEKTRQLLTHELFHVFHGQHNASPDFTQTEGLDWLVEGFATYASGQLDNGRMAEVKKLVTDNKAPASLDDYWKGKSRYGLSGSVVMFIDKQYGRDTLFEILKFSKKQQVLDVLKTSEEDFVNQWKAFVGKN